MKRKPDERKLNIFREDKNDRAKEGESCRLNIKKRQ